MKVSIFEQNTLITIYPGILIVLVSYETYHIIIIALASYMILVSNVGHELIQTAHGLALI